MFYARVLWLLYGQLPRALKLAPPAVSDIVEGLVYLIFVGVLPVAAAAAFLMVNWPGKRTAPSHLRWEDIKVEGHVRRPSRRTNRKDSPQVGRTGARLTGA